MTHASETPRPAKRGLATLKKFRASIDVNVGAMATPSIFASSCPPPLVTPSRPVSQSRRAQSELSASIKHTDLSASVPASFTYSSPGKATAGSRLLSASRWSSLLKRAPGSPKDTSSISDTRLDKLQQIEEHHIDETSTRPPSPVDVRTLKSGLRRTLSKLSLSNGTSITRATSNSSYSSSDGPHDSLLPAYSPKLRQYRLPRMQAINLSLGIDLCDDTTSSASEGEDGHTNKATQRSPRIGECASSALSCSMPTPTSSRARSLSKSPVLPPKDRKNVDGARYAELAHLITVIERSPPLPPKSRSQGTHDGRLASPMPSPASRSWHTRKLPSVDFSPIFKKSYRYDSLPRLQARKSGDLRSLSKFTDHKACKSLPNEFWPVLDHTDGKGSDDFSRAEASRRPPLKASRSLNDLLTCLDVAGPAVGESGPASQFCSPMPCYPALCTPEQSPRSRHATVEWCSDLVEHVGDASDIAQQVALDDSGLMPSTMPQDLVLLLQSIEDVQAKGDASEDIDPWESLTDIIDAFPSPVSAISGLSTPSSIWSSAATSLTSPSVSALQVDTPASEVTESGLRPIECKKIDTRAIEACHAALAAATRTPDA